MSSKLIPTAWIGVANTKVGVCVFDSIEAQLFEIGASTFPVSEPPQMLNELPVIPAAASVASSKSPTTVFGVGNCNTEVNVTFAGASGVASIRASSCCGASSPARASTLWRSVTEPQAARQIAIHAFIPHHTTDMRSLTLVCLLAQAALADDLARGREL